MIFFTPRKKTPPYYAGADSVVPVSTLLSLIDVLLRRRSVQLSIVSFKVSFVLCTGQYFASLTLKLMQEIMLQLIKVKG